MYESGLTQECALKLSYCMMFWNHFHSNFQLFLAPLQVACILPQNVLNTIFSNVEAIQAVNRELLSHMETLGLGDAFLAMAPFIKLYSTYANNFAKAQAALQVNSIIIINLLYWILWGGTALSFKILSLIFHMLWFVSGVGKEECGVCNLQESPRNAAWMQRIESSSAADYSCATGSQVPHCFSITWMQQQIVWYYNSHHDLWKCLHVVSWYFATETASQSVAWSFQTNVTTCYTLCVSTGHRKTEA